MIATIYLGKTEFYEREIATWDSYDTQIIKKTNQDIVFVTLTNKENITNPRLYDFPFSNDILKKYKEKFNYKDEFILNISVNISEQEHKYSGDELIKLAKNYYAAKSDSGHIPEHVEIDSANGDMVTIHLYDVVQLSEDDIHTATSDWYTVSRIDATGTNLPGEYIDLINP